MGSGIAHGGSSTARLFVALWPDPAVRARLAAQRDALGLPPNARPVADANLHLTLHFLGPVEGDRIASVWDALSRVGPRPMTLAASGWALWNAGTLVLRMQGDAALAALHEDLAVALRACGVPVDTRPFAPHVTLARAAPAVTLPRPSPLDWRPTGFALVESGGRSGPGYRVLATR